MPRRAWESIQWNWKIFTIVGVSGSGKSMTNPFNGIERIWRPSPASVRRTGIHSMELKVGSSPAGSKSSPRGESIQWNWKGYINPAENRGSRENPFNGIESRVCLKTVSLKLTHTPNPFNGIESENPMDNCTQNLVVWIHSMELKEGALSSHYSTWPGNPESIQWNWKTNQVHRITFKAQATNPFNGIES